MQLGQEQTSAPLLTEHTSDLAQGDPAQAQANGSETMLHWFGTHVNVGARPTCITQTSRDPQLEPAPHTTGQADSVTCQVVLSQLA